MIEIIENCSPYYIKFKFDGLEELIDYAKSVHTDITDLNFTQGYYPLDAAKNVINRLPFADKFKWHYTRVSPFITGPGVSSRIHKDGKCTRVSFNLPLDLLDDKCITTWYTDEELSDCLTDNLQVSHNNITRIPNNWESKKRTPIKTMIHRPGEMVLFNTDIFHRWDNTASMNKRSVLTIRLSPDYESEMYFDKVSSVLLAHS